LGTWEGWQLSRLLKMAAASATADAGNENPPFFLYFAVIPIYHCMGALYSSALYPKVMFSEQLDGVFLIISSFLFKICHVLYAL